MIRPIDHTAPLIAVSFTDALDRLRNNLAEWHDFGELAPGRVYAVTPTILDLLEQYQEGIGAEIVRREENVLLPARIWSGEDLTGRRVAYHQSGRHGDELVHTAVIRQLQRTYPGVDIHHYATSIWCDNTRITAYNRDIGGQPHRLRLAFNLAQLSVYDYWIVPPNVGAMHRGESEQTHYELLEQCLGITIEQKRPFVWLPSKEYEAVRTQLESSVGRTEEGKDAASGIVSSILEEGAIVVQVNASELARTPPTDFLISIIREIRKHRGDVICLCGDGSHVTAIKEVLDADPKVPGVVAIANQPRGHSLYLSAHSILHVAAAAKVIVAPDSFLMHASAAFDVRCVALWQDDPAIIETYRIPSPESRMKHYPWVAVKGFSDDPREVAERVVGSITLTTGGEHAEAV